MPNLVPAQKRKSAPEKKGLSDKQEAFAVAYVTNGGNATAAAKEAGYSEDAARVLGPRNLRNALVLQRIYELTVQHIAAHAPKALGTMDKLLTARSEFVRFNAAADLLNRAGFKPVERHQMQVDGEFTVSIDLS
jgi:phage terminase small subunit